MHKPHARAFLIALSVFGAMYFGAIVFAVYEPSAAHGGLPRLLLNLDAYLACAAAGFLAAAMIRKRGIAIGLVAGLAAACLVALYHFSPGPATVVLDDWRFWLASVLLGGAGGLIWSLRALAAKLRRRRQGDAVPGGKAR